MLLIPIPVLFFRNGCDDCCCVFVGLCVGCFFGVFYVRLVALYYCLEDYFLGVEIALFFTNLKDEHLSKHNISSLVRSVVSPNFRCIYYFL